jgi:hypothetical protein
MRVIIPLNGERVDRTLVQVGFFVLAYLGLLFFGDQLGASMNAGKLVRTGIQAPTKAGPSSSPESGSFRF